MYPEEPVCRRYAAAVLDPDSKWSVLRLYQVVACPVLYLSDSWSAVGIRVRYRFAAIGAECARYGDPGG